MSVTGWMHTHARRRSGRSWCCCLTLNCYLVRVRHRIHTFAKPAVVASDPLTKHCGVQFRFAEKCCENSTTQPAGGWKKMNTGKKWDRRYFLATDKGLHYYENDQPSKKAKGSWYFSHDTVVQENVTEEAIVGSDKSKHYFALVLKRPDFVLYCRVGTAQEKTRWITFLRTALERFYYSIVGEDPNMYRWGPRFQELHKLRISFLKEHAQSLQSCLSVEDEVRKLEDECKEVQKDIEELGKEEDLIDCELHQWEDTA
eukprot:PhF_6_TR11554/c0_g1_i2/m.18573